MKKPDITICCFYPGEGETAEQIILRSFALFLRRELGLKLPPELMTDNEQEKSGKDFT